MMLVLAGFGQGLAIAGILPSTIIDIPGYIVLDDGGTIWRIGPRIDKIYIDKTLTPTGFSGTENVDWLNVEIRI